MKPPNNLWLCGKESFPIKETTTGMFNLSENFRSSFFESEILQPPPARIIGDFDDEISFKISFIALSSSKNSIFWVSIAKEEEEIIIICLWMSIGKSNKTGPFLPFKAMETAFFNSDSTSLESSTKTLYLVIGFTILTISVSWKPFCLILRSYLKS